MYGWLTWRHASNAVVYRKGNWRGIKFESILHTNALVRREISALVVFCLHNISSSLRSSSSTLDSFHPDISRLRIYLRRYRRGDGEGACDGVVLLIGEGGETGADIVGILCRPSLSELQQGVKEYNKTTHQDTFRG
jgi:hypothetical protein